MQPEDLDRALEAARNYVNQQMQPADLVALVSLGSRCHWTRTLPPTSKLLLNAVNSYNGTQRARAARRATSTTNQMEDTTSFTADESEYNDLNTDRELFAFPPLPSRWHTSTRRNRCSIFPAASRAMA